MTNIKSIYMCNLLLFCNFPTYTWRFQEFLCRKLNLKPVHVPKQNKEVSKLFYLQKQIWIFQHLKILLT